MIKKSLKYLALLLCSFPFLNGCNNSNKIYVTFGTYINNDVRELTVDDLKDKMEGDYKGENFLLVTYLKNNGEVSCGCTNTFLGIAQQYVNKTNTLVYKINRNLFDSTNMEIITKWGIDVPSADKPTFLIVKNGKVALQYTYRSGQDSIFENYYSFEKEINNRITKPQIYYTNDEILSARIASGKETVVMFTRETCSDCSYCLPNVLFNYSYKNTLKNEINIFDIDPYRGTENYQKIKDKYFLSEQANKDFGYDLGVVPTTQYYLNGSLKSASVYFNDTLTKINNKWVVSQTYYTEERMAKLEYLDENIFSPLQGLEILDESEVIEYEGVGYWNKSAAAKFHTPILEAFLDKYCK